jgi:tetratricopeptide (TPR) repeat protein
MSLIDQALAVNPESIQANIEKGNSLHYAPSMFGGNPTDAVNYYKKAIKIFEEKNQGVPPQNWIYLNTLAQLALTYEKANQPENAQKTYKGILSIAPDFKWVKDELYPEFLKSNR